VFDKFHVVKHLHEAVDRVRRGEHRTLKGVGDERLTGSKYLWLRRPEDLSEPQRAAFRALQREDLKVGRAWALKERFRTEPLTVGADRVVNTLAACELYRRDTIVVDYGTATTFDCVTQDRRFIGGVIAPGVLTAAENLTRRAAKLPGTELLPPQRVIGRRTEDCIRSGVLFGAADSTDGMVRRIKAEWPGGGKPLVVGTGGLVSLVAPLSREIEKVEPHLTLLGLRIAAKHLGVV